jgi:hypothetical protein
MSPQGNPDIARVVSSLLGQAPPVVFFIGAGLSRTLGLPGWRDLLAGAADYGVAIGRLDGDDRTTISGLLADGEYLRCGTYLREKLGIRLDSYLRDLFDSPLPSDLGAYEYLIRLPCLGYITTNYDHALETAYSKHYRRPLRPLTPFDFPALANAVRRQPFLVKLHGDSSRGQFVLTESDYEAITRNVAFERFLYSIFFQHTVVFLGYGLSDHDLLTPLRLLSDDYGALTKRHIAILPSTVSPEERRRLEDSYPIDVITYDVESDGHGFVGRTILEWFVRTVDHRGAPRLEDSPVDFAEVLHISPHLLTPRMRQACVRGANWLLGCSPRWGPTVGHPVRVANIAEGLLALAAVRDAPDLPTPPVPAHEVRRLIQMQNRDTGGFVSVTIQSTTPHPHSLAMVALSRWREVDPDIEVALLKAASWLLDRLDESKGGWRRYDGESDIAVVPSLWAFSALALAGAFPSLAWHTFRRRLVDAAVIGHSLTDPSVSCAAAGWLLWVVATLRDGGLMTDDDEILVHLAIEQLSDPRQLFTSESQAIVVPGDSVSGWRTWLHPAAAAVCLGSLQWLSTHEDCSGIAGRALAAIMQQAAQGEDGRFHDAVLESQDAHLIFPTAYATWALAEGVRRIGGRGAIIRIAAVCVEDGRVLLVRQKGRRLLTLPNTVATGDPVSALTEHIRTEIGAVVSDLVPWRTFEDRAAFEPETSIQIHAYLAQVRDGWRAGREGVEVVWFDIMFDDPDLLSPIVRNQVVPAIKSRIMTDSGLLS